MRLKFKSFQVQAVLPQGWVSFLCQCLESQCNQVSLLKSTKQVSFLRQTSRWFTSLFQQPPFSACIICRWDVWLTLHTLCSVSSFLVMDDMHSEKLDWKRMQKTLPEKFGIRESWWRNLRHKREHQLLWIQLMSLTSFTVFTECHATFTFMCAEVLKCQRNNTNSLLRFVQRFGVLFVFWGLDVLFNLVQLLLLCPLRERHKRLTPPVSTFIQFIITVESTQQGYSKVWVSMDNRSSQCQHIPLGWW